MQSEIRHNYLYEVNDNARQRKPTEWNAKVIPTVIRCCKLERLRVNNIHFAMFSFYN